MNKIPKILSIAGSDSGGGAGIQADIKAISFHKGYAMTVLTAVTAQNTLGVQEIFPLPREIIKKQLESVMDDLTPDVIKTGMLADHETIELISEFIEKISSDGEVTTATIRQENKEKQKTFESDLGDAGEVLEKAPEATTDFSNLYS